MQTLLTKVEEIESAAATQVEEARSAGTRKLSSLVTDEERVLDDVRTKAQERGAQIVKERVDSTKETLNELHQEEARSVESIHRSAEKNRARAVDVVLTLFQEQYLS